MYSSDGMLTMLACVCVSVAEERKDLDHIITSQCATWVPFIEATYTSNINCPHRRVCLLPFQKAFNKQAPM